MIPVTRRGTIQVTGRATEKTEIVSAVEAGMAIVLVATNQAARIALNFMFG